MAQPSTLEDHVEAYLVKRVKDLGGISLKTDRVMGRRFLDRTCFLPGGVTLIVELKRPKGGVFAAHQVEYMERLQRMGHKVYAAKTKAEVDAILEEALAKEV